MIGEKQNRTNQGLKLGTGLRRKKNLLLNSELQSSSCINWWSESFCQCDPKKPHTEFKRKDKRDTVELEFIQLGKQFNVPGDEGEGEVKEAESLTHKDLDNDRACGRQRSQEERLFGKDHECSFGQVAF